MNLNFMHPGRRWRDLQMLLGLRYQKWPDWLDIIRHAESEANAERERATVARAEKLELSIRDMDVPLSAYGMQQPAFIGRWYAAQPVWRRPTVFISSPYTRAVQTRDGILDAAGNALRGIKIVNPDERLGERLCGVIEGLTKLGVQHLLPEEWHRRTLLDKLYYAPPGGESWFDVIQRLRSFNDMLIREYPGERVAITCHSVVVCCFRYLLERQDEQALLKMDREQDVPNCSITSYRFDRYAGRNGKLLLDQPYFMAPGLSELRRVA